MTSHAILPNMIRLSLVRLARAGILAAPLALLVLPAAARAQSVRHVPAQHPTITAAIAAAVDGDSIVIASGTYRETLVLNGKAITIISQAARAGAERAADSTIIDGGGAPRVVLVDRTQRKPVALVGLTIQNGDDCIYGHGIFHLLRSRITGCTDGIDYDRTGGGILRGNVFEGNRDDGIDLDHDVRALIEHNLIRNNNGDGIEIRLQPYTGEVAESVIRYNAIHGNREDGIQIIDYPGVAKRRLVLVGNVISDNGQAGIGCMSDAVTREDFRAAVIPEPIVLEGNLLRGHQVELSCGGDNARQRAAITPAAN